VLHGLPTILSSHLLKIKSVGYAKSSAIGVFSVWGEGACAQMQEVLQYVHKQNKHHVCCEILV
jgi:hypothetical protein